MPASPTRTLASLLALFLSFITLHAQENQAARTERQQMEQWWAELAQEEPVASRALLKFAFRFEKSVPFLKEKMQPLKINAAKVREHLKKLESNDEAVWKPAFDELDYFDPRLAIDLETLFEEVTNKKARYRLAALLSGRKISIVENKDIVLQPLANGEGFNFWDGTGRWWAESQVSRLNADRVANRKMVWVRTLRAINLLDQIGTTDAMAMILVMTLGHPDAEPTRYAKERIEARTPAKP